MASGRDLPHDLATFVIEAALGIQQGFWGMLARGATFKSVPGRRQTKPGRELIRAHSEALYTAEGVVNAHVDAWRKRVPTPTSSALDEMLSRWRALAEAEELSLEWSTRPDHRRPQP